MKVTGGMVFFFLGFVQLTWGQTNGARSVAGAGETETTLSSDDYAVQGATPQQEALLRSQIQIMEPAVLPLRVVFLPHWKYVDSTRVFHLHVPTGYTSTMFTHLPSRTVFIDNDYYPGEKWLGYWVAHELGHLARNSTKEGDAEKAAREFRKRLNDAHGKLLQAKPPAPQGTGQQQETAKLQT